MHPAHKRLSASPRLYLLSPPIADADAFGRTLAAALSSTDVAAVLLRLTDADERTQINRVKALAPIVQDKGIALLLEGHANLVARGGADGAHLTGIDAMNAAIEELKPDRIAGVGGLTSRHDAMVAGENNADYVMFGDAPGGRRPEFGAVLERVEWWSEIFQVPCVALAAGMDEIAPLASAGADFVAVGDFIWSDRNGAANALAASAQMLALTEATA